MAAMGYNTDQPPLDGTWIAAWDFGSDRIIQYDPTAYGGKGGWFTKKGHATKGPHELHGWKLADAELIASSVGSSTISQAHNLNYK